MVTDVPYIGRLMGRHVKCASKYERTSREELFGTCFCLSE